jgi:carbon-monoxide dehydrogenase large subunit
LELPIERIRHVHHGSTAYVSDGYGAYHSRSIVMGGSALLDATKNLHALIHTAAARRLGCEPSQVRISEDRVVVMGAQGDSGTTLTLSDFAGLTAEGIFLNKKHTYTYGAHAAHVAVDPHTGGVEIIDYLTVVDCGRIINPMTVRGQVIGSLVQGLGGAMLEDLVYDEDGQLLTGSLADYLLPTASDFPNLRAVVTDEFPSPINPLGAKGAGEGGIISAGGIMANAIANALTAFQVEPRELPLSPPRIWEMIEAGRGRGRSVANSI